MAADTIDLHVRLPRTLHERLTELAEARGLSLNTALILAAWDAVDSKPPTAGRRATPRPAPSAADA